MISLDYRRNSRAGFYFKPMALVAVVYVVFLWLSFKKNYEHYVETAKGGAFTRRPYHVIK